MTKAEKIRIYQSMEEKILRTLDERPGERLVCEDTRLALELLQDLTVAQWRLEEGNIPAETWPEPDPEQADFADAPELVPDPEPIPEPEPEPAPKSESELEGETLTKEEVRAELAALATNPKVNVAAIMAGMGYSKLSDVPASRYRELLDKANAAKET